MIKNEKTRIQPTERTYADNANKLHSDLDSNYNKFNYFMYNTLTHYKITKPTPVIENISIVKILT